MHVKNIAVALLLFIAGQGLALDAFAAGEGNLTGRVLRSRDSQPLADSRVQIAETGAKTTTNAQGVYSFADLRPGTYTVVVTPAGGGSPVQHKVTIAAGKTARVWPCTEVR